MPGRRASGNGGSQRGSSEIPPSWLSGWLDPELEQLFHNKPELIETAGLLRASRPDPQPDAHFRAQLRNHLMAEAEQAHNRGGLRRWWRPSPAHFAWGGAGLGVALIGATVLTLLAGRVQDHQNVIAFSSVAAQHAVSPDHVITVAFNQAMDQQAVVAGLHIEPATQVQTTWQGNNLIISPVHHLAGNTPYTVTIAQPALRSASGATAPAPLQITFGTASTPPPGPTTATPPSLVPSVVGEGGSGAQLLFAPDGSVVSTAGRTAQPSPSASPSASAGTAVASPTAAASPTSSSASPSPSSAPSSDAFSVIEFLRSGGAPLVLGRSATAAGFSADGASLATAQPDGQGGSEIVISLANGTKPKVLTDSTAPVTGLTWATSSRLIYSTASTISAVDLAGAREAFITLPAGSGTLVALSPGGAYAYVAPAAGSGGQLLKVASGTGRLLSGAVRDVAFSGDGKTVAWVDRSGLQPRLLIEPVDRDAPASVSALDPTADLSAISLNSDGTEAGYVLTPSSGAPRLVIAELPSGAPLAVGPAGSAVAFSPAGDSIALLVSGVSGLEIQTAVIPGARSPQLPSGLPAAASSALHAFTDAQVQGDHAALTTLSAPGVDASTATPKGLSRANIVSSVTRPDGTVLASVELIVDPTSDHATALVADEALTLAPASDGQTYVVASISVSPLHDQAAGPHIVRVATTRSHGKVVVQISFDSDLNPATVAVAISVLSAQGVAVPLSTVYDANSRTATVTLASPPKGALTVAVGTTLRDINGQAPSVAFQAHVDAG